LPQQFFQLRLKLRVERPAINLGPRPRGQVLRLGESQDRHYLVVGLLASRIENSRYGPLRLIHRGSFVPMIRHRVAIVEQDEMVRHPAAKQPRPSRTNHRSSQHEHHQSDRRGAHEQQQQLLQHDPFLIPLLALQQKLHRRPLDAPMPPQVDQVDQQR
jgi:hypothetical protein